ncbi:MAG: lipoprotein-releasing ABC transporter permease subunit [bacterium]
MHLLNIPYEVTIGLRYLRAKRKQTVISIITLISILGVALGVAALIIVLAVMSGFEMDLRDKILGTNAHIVILKSQKQGIRDYTSLIPDLEKIDNVIAVSPFIYSQVMLSSDKTALGVILRGIEPESEIHVTDLDKNMIPGQGKLLDLVKNNEEGIIIGKELALILGVEFGEEVTAISAMTRMTPMGSAPNMKTLKIVGVFHSGMYEYDTSMAYVSLETAQKFLSMPDVITGLEVKTKNIFKAKETAQHIQNHLGYPYWTRDWMEMNRNLFSALKLEKLAMFIILILIILVAAFNIISNLVMMVMEKHKDIGILKSMGASSRSILYIFVIEGLIIGIIGTLIGCVGGSLICHIADKYHLIKLQADVYYISYLPFKMKFFDIFAICLTSILISLLATIYPSWQASSLDPVVALRYE